ncbi:MAG: hypothetical protein K2X62_04920 [Beijerinckiaceae bacterium]|jgi:hypothetical protein|nr:hypothetical protein [Beijerinckiaceae bacterium]MDO9442762.1 hypothetical protein [Beijerinckiaceae bacterium]
MNRDPDHDQRAQDARRALDARRTLEEMSSASGGVFESALQRGADHFAGRDAPAEDRVEVWGRRIGRLLGLAFLILLLVNLATGWFF